MPPKTKFSLEDVVDTAFEIAKREGIESITIRSVAQKLGSSIAPIYVNFKTIDELKQAVIEKVFQVSQEMLKVQYSDEPFLNAGIASLKFAREYPVLFRDLVWSDNKYLQDNQLDMSNIVAGMSQDPELAGLSEEQCMEILFKMRVFTLGLSVMEAGGMLPKEFDENMVIEFLASMGNDVVSVARLRNQGK